MATTSTIRKPFIAGNWKMHNTHTEGAALAAAVAAQLGTPRARVMVAPPFTALAAVGDALRGTAVELGAQNVSPEAAGAHTGEIACSMLQALGVGVVIVGHSERRHGYGEDDALIARKVTAAVAAGLDVVLCVGETLADREAGVAEAVVAGQLRAALAGRDAAHLQRITVAYEPVWAIGTGRTASTEDAAAMHRAVRAVVAELAGTAAARELVIQYGGSVKPDNAAALLACEDIDGLLVGGASLEADSFARIVAAAASRRPGPDHAAR
jgi:triosephosphate isomerase